MTTRTMSATELSKNLSDVLNRIKYQGDQFIIERNGEPIAAIGPALPAAGRTMKEIAERIGHLRMPGDGFADDLEAIQAEQGVAELPEWPS